MKARGLKKKLRMKRQPQQLSAKEKCFSEMFKQLGGIGRSPEAQREQKRACVHANWTCAVCGRQAKSRKQKHAKRTKILKMMGAHIEPHEEDGTNDPINLVCLCVQKRSLRQGVGKVGCHDLFDNYQVWSRREMATLQKAAAGTPEGNKTRDVLLRKRKKLKDRLELALANRWWRKAGELVQKRTAKEKDLSERIRLRCDSLVAARKGGGRGRWPVIRRLVGKIMEDLSAGTATVAQKARVGYEVGMLFFQLRRFQDAAAMIQGTAVRRDPGSLINLAQASVARFEELRRGVRPQRGVGQIIDELQSVVTRIDQRCRGYSKWDDEKRKKLGKLLPWRIDSRLHLARMLAFSGRTGEAQTTLNQAVRLRHRSVVEPSVFTTLALAKGEVALSAKTPQGYSDAVKALGRAGYKLICTGHKDFEHLETVVHLLRRIPFATVVKEKALLDGLATRLREHLDYLGQQSTAELSAIERLILSR